MSAPLISVVIPTYNYARFLEACVQSVRDQDYPKMELVIVDDKSTDDTPVALEALKRRREVLGAFSGGVHVEINEKNLGAHATINRAMGLARGEYICILNADDTFARGRLSCMLREMQQADARFAFSRVDFIDGDGRELSGPDPLVHRLRRRQAAVDRFPTVGFACTASNVAISTGNFMFERRLFEEVGPFKNLRYCHDWDFLLRALLITEPLYVPTAAYNYRVHGTNSFRSLDHVAATESAAVYQAFFSELILGRQRNPRAPSPTAWPGVFELFMTAYGLWDHWPGGHS